MDRHDRTEQMVFGRKTVLEAVDQNSQIDRIYIRKGLKDETVFEITAKGRDRDIPILYVPTEKLDRLTRKNHQGIVALISPVPFYEVNDILGQVYDDGEIPLLLLLDGVTDVYNFGAIARTAWCTGVHAIVTASTGSAALNGSAIKASAGALLQLPICRVPSLKQAAKDMKDAGLLLVTAESTAESEVGAIDLNCPLAFVMGAEGSGVSLDLQRMADCSVKIPMQRDFDSYNVSVSAAMLLYESMRQKK